jgi:hypothetical protein
LKNPDEIRDEIRAKRLAPGSPFRYRWLWQAVLSEMSDAELRLAVSIWLHSDENGERAFPGQQALAALSRVSTRSIRSRTRALELAGFLNAETGAGKRTTNYTLTIPERTLIELDQLCAERAASGLGGKSLFRESIQRSTQITNTAAGYL